MTMPDERTRAVAHTQDFLKSLLNPRATPGVPEPVREQARALLRHYPSRGDMALAHGACPIWFGAPPERDSQP